MNRALIASISIVFLFTSCKQTSLRETETTYSQDTTSTTVSDPAVDAAEPAVAADGEGNIYVAYVEHNPDKTADLYVQKYDRDFHPAGYVARVNPVPGQVKAWRGDPPVMTLANDGTLYIGWIVKVDSTEKIDANDLVVSVSKDGGRSFNAPVRVSDNAQAENYGLISLISDTGGQLGVAWLDERNLKAAPTDNSPAAASMMFHHHEEAESNREVFFALSTDEGKTFSANKKIASDACPCCKTSMAAGPDGRIYVSWRQVLPNGNRHIAVASSSDKGSTFSGGVIVSDDKWHLDACPVSGAFLSTGSDGALSVLWYSAGAAGEAGIYSTESKDGGKTFDPRRMVSARAVSGMPALLDAGSGRFAIFAAKDNQVLIAKNFPADASGSPETIPDASLPAAVYANSNKYVAFVRTTGEKRTVWLARLHS